MKREKVRYEQDPRINVRSFSAREYWILFLTLVVISGFDIWLLLALMEKTTHTGNYLLSEIFIMVGYLFLVATVLMIFTALIRRYYFERPLRHLSEGAKKIARGDFSVRIAPMRKDGKKDYTEVLFDDFNTMAAELANIETLKNDFIANVSHEIKTPLSVIQGYAAALQSDTLTIEERRDYAKTIVDATQKLSALVTNILKLNKLENQEIVPEAASYDLGEQLRRCSLAFEDLWEERGITFDADLDEAVVHYDPGMLEIVWNNLLSNAVKFTEPGGLIAVSLKATDGFALVTVRDNGCGMDAETAKHIFDKFYQGDTSHSGEGNGLGLAMVKRVIEITGGEISVDSEPGQGTAFTVRLKI
ncbi:two component sensor kinase [Spirochaetia bacterium]|nr:two component sensor kinase [Spirochaetia bacterium]